MFHSEQKVMFLFRVYLECDKAFKLKNEIRNNLLF